MQNACQDPGDKINMLSTFIAVAGSILGDPGDKGNCLQAATALLPLVGYITCLRNEGNGWLDLDANFRLEEICT